MTMLSVVVPVRNAGRYIGDALTSLLNNADDDFEFIVVDDASSDDTPDVIEEYRARVPRLQVLRQPKAGGPSAARNLGLDHAQGRYVTFLDGDDWIARGYLAQLVDAIEGLDVQFVRVDHVQQGPRGRSIHHAPESRRDVVLEPRSGIFPANDVSMVDYPYSWAGIYRRDLGELLRFPEHLHTAEDRPWIWRLHRETSTYAVVSLLGLFYRRSVTGSLTQIGDERQLHFLPAFEMVFDQVRDEPDVLPKAVRQFIGVLSRHLMIDRLEPEMRRYLDTHARDALESLPGDALVEAEISAERMVHLRRLLPPSHPATRRLASR